MARNRVLFTDRGLRSTIGTKAIESFGDSGITHELIEDGEQARGYIDQYGKTIAALMMKSKVAHMWRSRARGPADTPCYDSEEAKRVALHAAERGIHITCFTLNSWEGQYLSQRVASPITFIDFDDYIARDAYIEEIVLRIGRTVLESYHKEEMDRR